MNELPRAAQHESAMMYISVSLVKLYADEHHEGRIPENHEAFIDEIVEGYLSTETRHLGGMTTEGWLQEREELATYLRTAIETEELCRKTKYKN